MHRLPNGLLVGILLLAAVFAHSGSLLADFFFDDHYFVVDANGIGAAQWSIYLGQTPILRVAAPTYSCQVTGLISGLFFNITGLLFGVNPVISHLWTLLFHIVLVLIGFSTLRVFSEKLAKLEPEQAKLVSFLGAAMTACHPLGAETVNYAKCVYVQLVAIFALASCRALILANLVPTLKNWTLFSAFSLACSLSYHYGLALCAAQCLVLVMWMHGAEFHSLWGKLQALPLRSRVFRLGIILLPLVLFGFHAVKIIKNWLKWGHPFADHFMTQCVTFWQTVSAVFYPVGLCADHWTPWRVSFAHFGTVLAVLSLCGLLICLILLPFSRWRTTRGGALGLALFLAACPMLIRFFHANPEVRVDYRVYPSLPWIGLLLATLLIRVFRSRKLLLSGSIVVLAAMSVQSQRISRKWDDGEAHAAEILKQYPLNNRVRLHGVNSMITKLDRDALQNRVKEMVAASDALRQFNRTNSALRYDEFRDDLQLARGYAGLVNLEGQKSSKEEANAVYARLLDELKEKRPEFFLARNLRPPLVNLLHKARAGYDFEFRQTHNIDPYAHWTTIYLQKEETKAQ